MGVSRKQALKHIHGLSAQIEIHLAKLEAGAADASAAHWRAEVEHWIVQVLDAAKVVGKRTEGQLRQQVLAWRRQMEQNNAPDPG
jgi:hypothetical protein